jgi:hypothetical protein
MRGPNPSPSKSTYQPLFFKRGLPLDQSGLFRPHNVRGGPRVHRFTGATAKGFDRSQTAPNPVPGNRVLPSRRGRGELHGFFRSPSGHMRLEQGSGKTVPGPNPVHSA